MRIVWCTLQFLDYRIPVFEALSKLKNVELYLVFSAEVNSERIIEKTKQALGNKAIPLHGELSIGKASTDSFANSGFRLPYQKGLIQTIKKLNPDVMVSDGFFQWSYAPLYIRATKKIPHVMCYERTMHTERNAQGIRKKYRKFASKYIDAVCCSGKLCGDYIETFGFTENLRTYGFMVADTNKAEVTQSLSKEIELNNGMAQNVKRPIYLFVGQLIERKGVIKLVDAWQEFSKKINHKATLVIIGEGYLEDKIKEAITDSSCNIKLLGKIPYDDMLSHYKSSDIFIMPTLEDNWSLVVPEAMNAGLPVMTTIYNGCYPELVKPENGWVFDSLNQEDFVSKLIESYNSKADFLKMGKASKEILKHYNPKTAAKSIYDACNIAINAINVK